MAVSQNACSYLSAEKSVWFSNEQLLQAGRKGQDVWDVPSRRLSTNKIRAHPWQSLSYKGCLSTVPYIPGPLQHLHLYSNLSMKLALPLPPIRAQLELGHQQGLVLINLLIHAVSTGLIFLLLLWERKLKKELPGMMHPAAVSSEFQKARAEVWWDLAKMENVKGGSGT